MKATSYPHIKDQPEYAAEAAKLQNFYERRAEAQRNIDELNAQFVRNQSGSSAASIDYADELIENDGHVRGLREKIAAQIETVAAINRALPAQTHRVFAVQTELTHKARAHFAVDHKRLVQKILDAAIALDQANKAQREFVEAARSLGYHDNVLTDWTCSKVGRDIHDPDSEDSAYYRFRDMREYVSEPDDVTPDESMRNARRKGKLAQLLG